MGILPSSIRVSLSTLIGLITLGLALPAFASAACSLPTGPVDGSLDHGVNPGDEVVYQGTLTDDVNQDYLQIPFEVGPGIKGMRIRYCYEKQVAGDASPTLDLGLYGPKQPGADNWTMDDLRGWSGSAVKLIGIGENGYSPAGAYEALPKGYVPGRTTRAYSPGPITPGTWAVELGAGWIPPGGLNYRVAVVQSTSSAWADDPFHPTPYSPYVANPKPGWYQGDTHVHGEQEPGNATMMDSLDLAFAPIVPGQPKQGAGLDFVDLVDHNNDFSRQMLGDPAYRHPGKLVIPGTEITTYRGHMNSQDASRMVDFRTNPIYRFPQQDGAGPFTLDQSTLSGVANENEPADLFPEIDRLGGWGQLNHPTTWATDPAACRGCAWSYSDAETGYRNVDAMEVANGIADLNHGNPPISFNPFTGPAIDLYEQRLAASDHIAATASSDDHRAGSGYGSGTDPVIGQGTTVVYARELSPSGIRDAIRAGQTYIKVFGADAPDVYLNASTPEGYRGIEGHSLKGRELNLKLRVNGAADNPRPGSWFIQILRDGLPVKILPVTGNRFSTSYSSAVSGRYGFRLYRDNSKIVEAYGTPVWYRNGAVASPAPQFRRLKRNPRKGTATIRIRTIGAGQLVLKPGAVRRRSARTTAKRRTVTLKLVPTAKARRQLKRKGRAKVRLAVTFTSQWTDARTARKTVVLKQKVKKRSKRQRRHR